MIGKPEWFTYRKFGWGISPRTWQGWVYVAAVAALVGFSTAVNLAGRAKLWIFSVIIGIIVIDIMHIMVQLPKVHDERENYHQMLIERNCSFAAVAVIAGIAIFQSYINKETVLAGRIPFDISLIIVLGVMVLTKVASSYYLAHKM